MDNIKEIIQTVIGSISSHKKLPGQLHLQSLWQNNLSEQENEHVQLSGERDGVLSVVVDSPAWLYQMNTKKQVILQKIRKDCPHIKSIHFKIGKVNG